MRTLPVIDITNIVRLPPSLLSGRKVVAIEAARQAFYLYSDRKPDEFSQWIDVGVPLRGLQQLPK